MTAMDDHFRDQEVEVPEGVEAAQEGAAEPPAPSKGFDLKRVLSGAFMLGLGGLVGYHFYGKYFPGQETGSASFHVAEVETAPAQHAPAALVSNAPASSASGAEFTPAVSAGPASAPLVPAAPDVPSAPKAPSAQGLQVERAAEQQVLPRTVAQGSQVTSQVTSDQAAKALSAERQARSEAIRLSDDLKAANEKAAKLEADVARLNERIRALEAGKPSPAPTSGNQAQAAVASRSSTSKPAAAIAQKHVPAAKVQVAPPAAPVASTPRAASTVTAPPARFRIYAMRENMAWVQDVKTRETIPAPVGATLPDGSRVQRVDESEGVISTTSGEIRYAGSGRN